MTRSRSALALDALTWAIVVVMIAPIVWLILSSLQTNLQISNGTYDFLHPTFDAFSRMWMTVDFERYFLNSLIICTLAALTATAFAACAGYSLARYRFRGGRPFRRVAARLRSRRLGGVDLLERLVGPAR